MAAERSLVRPFCPGESVEVVGLERFGQLEVDFSLVPGDQLLPACLARVGRRVFLGRVELGLFPCQNLGLGEVGAEEAAVFRPLDGVVLETELEQGDHELPPPAWADRPVNPALRTKWRWILRFFALLVIVVVLGAVYLVIHAYITHESIQHLWSQVRSPF